MPRITSHPGEILLHEYMEPMDLSANQLAKDLRIPANRISEIVRGRRSVTADTAIRLSRYFGTTPEFWMNLQAAHDLSAAFAAHGDSITTEITPALHMA
ncbi:MAG: HigA family addiction module antitoxin [Pseudomonadota bacterium]|nr:HigA family addiction module antitoxin [Pseudomonadota bacterium]